MKSSVSKVKCRRYKKWIQGKSGIWQFIDDAFWFYSSWGNQINQSKNHNLLSEAYGLKKPQVTPHHHEVLNLLRIQLVSFGGDQWSLTMTTLPDGKHSLRFRWSSWHWADHLDGLGNKGELRLVKLPTFSWSTEDRSSGNTPSCGVLACGFSRLWWSLSKHWTKAEPEMMNIYQ